MPPDRPTILVDGFQNTASKRANDNNYKGHVIHALPGLHAYLANKATKYFEPNSYLLDLAAGSGAFSLRMQDLGFRVSATDYLDSNFKISSIPFRQADLNSSFAQNYTELFDAIVATEIIEHLENPRHFARQCFALLRPGGRMLLSTPNVDSPGSKASFLRTGCFAWFGPEDYERQGHITPLTQIQIEQIFVEAGFNFLCKGSFGIGSSRLLGSPRLQIIANLISLVSSTRSSLAGEIFVAVMEKADKKPVHYNLPQ